MYIIRRNCPSISLAFPGHVGANFCYCSFASFFFGVLTIVSGVVRGIMDREGIFLMFWEKAVGNLFMSLILMNRDHIALWEN